MPQYKLTYFDVRGLAEATRVLLAYAKVPYEDVRLALGTLTDEKKAELELPWGQLPVLEINGKKFGQSLAFTRYLARKHKLVGKDEFDELKCDEIVDSFRDYAMKWSPMFALEMDPNSDPAKKAEVLKPILEVESPKCLGRFNDLLEKSKDGWLVGNSLTWADIYIATFVPSFEIAFGVKLSADFPALQKLISKVQNTPGIKEWIAKRPQTKF